MGESNSGKPGVRPPPAPSSTAAPARRSGVPNAPVPNATAPNTTAPPKAAAPPKATGAPNRSNSANAAGRVVHDARGNAVWDWFKETTRVAIDSTSRLLRKLEVPGLKVEETVDEELRLESDRDPGGGYDPYGTSSPPPRTNNRTAAPTGGGGSTPGVNKSAGGGYDPYQSGPRKPGRKF